MDTKEETLGKLYALRAGVSFIACETQQLMPLQNKIDAYDKACKVADELKNSTDTKMKYSRNFEHGADPCWDEQALEYYKEIRKINREVNIEAEDNFINIMESMASDKIAEIQDIKNHNKKVSISRANKAMIVGACIGFIAAIPMLIFRIWGLATFVIIGVLILAISYVEKKKLASEKEGEKPLTEEEKEALKNIEYCNEKRQKSAELLNRMKTFEQERESLTSELKNKTVIIAHNTRPVYYALKASTSDLISESDWGNLDLIIYYFETGRADTIKEALLLVDRQKQTDQIVSAIQEASREISFMIKAATEAIAGAIDIACNKICGRINEVNENIKTLTTQQERLSGDVIKVANAASLQNALLSQANRTSTEMAKDVAYIRKAY